MSTTENAVKKTRVTLVNGTPNNFHEALVSAEIDTQGNIRFLEDVSKFDFESKHVFVELPDNNLPAFNIVKLGEHFNLALAVPVHMLENIPTYAPEMAALREFVSKPARSMRP